MYIEYLSLINVEIKIYSNRKKSIYMCLCERVCMEEIGFTPYLYIMSYTQMHINTDNAIMFLSVYRMGDSALCMY